MFNDDQLLETVDLLTEAEIKRDLLLRQLLRVFDEIITLRDTLDQLKLEMKAEQDAIKAAFEKGGVPPSEEYPEYIDEEKLIYHRKEDLVLHPKVREFLGDGEHSDRSVPTEQV